MSVNLSLKDEIRDYWSLRSETFDTQPGHAVLSDEERQAWLALLARHLGDGRGRRALDLACGTGEISLLLAALGLSVTGLDLSDAMLTRARAKIGRYPIRVFAGDAEETLEPSASYDAVVTRHLVWTLPDPARAFAEWLRVLKPGGRLVVIDADLDHVAPGRILTALLARLAKRLSTLPPPPAYAAKHAAILERVHFAKGCRPDAVAALLREAGFADVTIDRDLAAVHRAQGRLMPLWQRLERQAQDRFVIAARKPD